MTKPFYAFVLALLILILVSADGYAQRARSSVSGAEVTGTFEKRFTGKFKEHANRIDILALGGGKLKVAFDLLYPYTLENENGPMSAHLGSISGEASIKGDTAVLESNENGPCTITIKFVRPGQVTVTQSPADATCGFGHNVTSAGTYRKVSGKKPKFDRE